MSAVLPVDQFEGYRAPPALIALAALAVLALAGCATGTQAPQGPAPPAPPSLAKTAPPAPPLIPETEPFAPELRRFAELDQTAAPPACPVLFVGSSSIRLWSDLPGDMAPLPVINRGFGGSQIADVNRNFALVVAPYRPRAIVFYAGENDIAMGRPPAETVAEFARFMAMKDEAFGDTPVFFVSLKPSKLRFAQMAAQGEVNAAVRAMAKARPDLEFIDVAPSMLEGGQPKDIFLGDGLHMTPAGYAIWREVISMALNHAGVLERTCPTPSVVVDGHREGAGVAAGGGVALDRKLAADVEAQPAGRPQP